MPTDYVYALIEYVSTLYKVVNSVTTKGRYGEYDDNEG